LPKELTNNLAGTDPGAFAFDFPIPPEGINLEEAVDNFTSQLIRQVVHMVEGNISQAAKLLGIPRGTLRYKLEKYDAGNS
jgi:DNA-binding NtrC family response regulator